MPIHQQQQQDAKPPRTCFHCGQSGHMAAQCIAKLRKQERTPEGQAAFRSYLTTGAQQQGTEGEIVVPPRRADNSLHHYHKLQIWMQEQQKQQASSPDDNHQIGDPISLAFAAASPNKTHPSLRKDLFHSYRDLFDQTMKALHKRYKQHISHHYDDDNDNEEKDFGWREILTEAVKEGTPAEFCDAAALRGYTLEKMAPRCRQLHHLIMDHDNDFSQSIRALLLPRSTSSSSHDDNDNNRVVSVCSIGGGPAFDHISICCVVRFLQDLQSPSSMASSQTVDIHTRVFDLWDHHWGPIAEDLMHCWNNDDDTTTPTNSMTMHHADLRLSLESPSNHELLDAIPIADVIVFQFVLHENASFLVVNDDDDNADDDDVKKFLRDDCAVSDVFRRAKLGAIMVCTDSVNFLWPALKATATRHGWAYLGNAEKTHKIVLGPKSFVILERTNVVI